MRQESSGVRRVSGDAGGTETWERKAGVGEQRSCCWRGPVQVLGEVVLL